MLVWSKCFARRQSLVNALKRCKFEKVVNPVRVPAFILLNYFPGLFDIRFFFLNRLLVRFHRSVYNIGETDFHQEEYGVFTV